MLVIKGFVNKNVKFDKYIKINIFLTNICIIIII